jgi:hypothetical protein
MIAGMLVSARVQNSHIDGRPALGQGNLASEISWSVTVVRAIFETVRTGSVPAPR